MSGVAARAPSLDIKKPQRTKKNNIRSIVKTKTGNFAGFIVKAKQPSPCELGCLLIVVSISA